MVFYGLFFDFSEEINWEGIEIIGVFHAVVDGLFPGDEVIEMLDMGVMLGSLVELLFGGMSGGFWEGGI
jgi:hypothetical protein